MPGPTTMFTAMLLASALRLPFPATEGGATIAEHAGLHPAVVACAGVDTSKAIILLNNLEADGDRWSQVKAAQVLMDQTIQAIAVNQEVLELDPGDTEARDALVTARVNLRNAQVSFHGAQEQLVEAATNGLSDDAQALMKSCGVAQSFALPPEFGALNLDAASAKQLRLALIHENRASRRGEFVPDEVRDLLQQARSNRAVANAQVQLRINLAGVEAAWDQAR